MTNKNLWNEYLDTLQRWYEACNAHDPGWERGLCLAAPESPAQGTPTDIEYYLDRLYDAALGFVHFSGITDEEKESAGAMVEHIRDTILRHVKRE